MQLGRRWCEFLAPRGARTNNTVMTTLWEAAGYPNRAKGVPPSRCFGLISRSRLLCKAAELMGRAARRIRTWQGLCRVIWDSPPPSTATCGELHGELSVDHLAGRSSETADTHIHIVHWNSRWLADPTSAEGSAKRNAVLRHLLRGRVVVLQETHWWEHHAAQWKALTGHKYVLHLCCPWTAQWARRWGGHHSPSQTSTY